MPNNVLVRMRQHSYILPKPQNRFLTYGQSVVISITHSLCILGIEFFTHEMRIAFILFDHLLDVLIVVKNDPSDLGKWQSSVHTQVLERSG